MAVLITGCWALAGADSAHAQQKCTPDMDDEQKKEDAVKWWRQATNHYDLLRYRESIELYKNAYECAAMLPPSDKVTKTSANFLFNIAQAYRQLGECKPAIQFYRRYLWKTRNLTGDKEVRDIHAAVQATLETLEETCKKQEEVKQQSPTGTVEPDNENIDYADRDGAAGDAEEGSDDPDTAAADAAQMRSDDGAGIGGERGPQVTSADHDGKARGQRDSERPGRLSASVGMGLAVVGMGEIDVPAQYALALRAGYPLRLGMADVVVGGAFTYTPVPWRNHATDTSGTASLWNVLVDVGAGYPITGRIAARGHMGAGILNFSGLAMGNPFTLGGAEPQRPLTMFGVRVELGAEYAITRNIVVTVSPLVLSYSPADKSLRDVIGSLVRYECLIGAGYRM